MHNGNALAFSLLQEAQVHYVEESSEDMQDSYFILRFREIVQAFCHDGVDEDQLVDLERMEDWTRGKALFYSSNLPHQEDLGCYYQVAQEAYEQLHAGVFELILLLEDGEPEHLEEALDYAETGEQILKELQLEAYRDRDRILEATPCAIA